MRKTTRKKRRNWPEEKSVSGANPTSNSQGGLLDSEPPMCLPDKKLLLVILDRLQKKDTYGVFSEPVDPNELPDYHEVIEPPMDFGTIRKKLASGAYANLEQFEKDVFLVCSNAVQYNAPDTIYFRQARSIQELAEQNFENLRQDSDDNEAEPKVIRRGRPPTKNFKKPLGRPSLEHAASEFSSDATLATGAENTICSNQDMRKGPLASDKSDFADSFRKFYGFRNDVYSDWLTENKSDRSDEGSMLKGYTLKHGKRQFVLDENRRNTYKLFHPSAAAREASLWTTYDGEKKQLLAVAEICVLLCVLESEGILNSNNERGKAVDCIIGTFQSRQLFSLEFFHWGLGNLYLHRSQLPISCAVLSFLVDQLVRGILARFAANLGPVAWKIASKSIERCVPAGVNFGPGWVGENDVPAQRPLLLPSLSLPPGQQTSSQPCSIRQISFSASLSYALETREDKQTDKPEANNLSEKHVPSFHSISGGHLKASEGSSGTGFNMTNSSTGAVRPRPPLQIHQSPVIHPGMNGYNGAYGFYLPAQMAKIIGAAKSSGFSFQSSQMVDTVSRTTANFVNPATSNSNSNDPRFSENSCTKNPSCPFPNSGCETVAAPRSGLHPQPSWQGLSSHQKPGSRLSSQEKPDSRLSPHHKPGSVPPDLNIRFHSPGSPSSSQVDSAQPDLALQL
ncbi:hypothetical protein CRYUN_Cryun10bG0090700 [Craigia yunnanensis]